MYPYAMAKDLLAGMTIGWDEGRGEKQRRAFVLTVEYTKPSRLTEEFIHVEEHVRVTVVLEDGGTASRSFPPNLAIAHMAPITIPKKAQDENKG